ncbi:MAG: hypothetical protein M1816_007021 [Peltula sp. TS41687]|nr:MAG: hypothetical protein M1816_007021 [Peltula sp. TS41687]
MWICYDCIKRSILSLPQHRPSTVQVQSWRQSASLSGRPNSSTRSYAGVATAHASKETGGFNRQLTAWSRRDLRYGSYGDAQANVRVKLAKKHKKEVNVKEELKRLGDPFRLGLRVTDLLSKDQFDPALSLVRDASKSMDCTVSWNHLINYSMRIKKSHAAITLYNEMKKRAQTPDSYTYGLILRGLTEALDPQSSVAKALSIYQSMQAPNSPIKPAITHVNLVLKICAKVKDLDSLWSVASKLPERGIGAPDAITWTTILNAIRFEAESVSGPLRSTEQVFEWKQKAVIKGRRIWGDLVGKWRVGDLQVDEQLVSAMGRLLLLGGQPRDYDDVLSLVKQTMCIPRMASRLPLREGKGANKSDATTTSPRLLGDGHGKSEDLEVSPRNDAEKSSEFEVLVVARPARLEKPLVHTVSYASPSYNTLSLLIEACEKLFNKKAAMRYWEYFQQNVGLAPDSANYHSYLRVLRVMRAGGQALEIVRMMAKRPEIPLETKTFRIAMSACARDKINRQSFDHANELMELMKTHLSGGGYDPVSMIGYLEVAQHARDRGKVLHALQTVGRIVDQHVQDEDVPRPRKETAKIKKAKATKELLYLGELAGMLERGFVRSLNRSGDDRKRQGEYRQEIQKWSDLRKRIQKLSQGMKKEKIMSSFNERLKSGLL